MQSLRPGLNRWPLPYQGSALLAELQWQFERVIGIEPTSPAWKAGVLPLNYTRGWWGKKDSNLRRHTPADLQSAPFGRSGISPKNSIYAQIKTKKKKCKSASHREDSNLRPTDYKSVALPAELRWHVAQIKTNKKSDLPLTFFGGQIKYNCRKM